MASLVRIVTQRLRTDGWPEAGQTYDEPGWAVTRHHAGFVEVAYWGEIPSDERREVLHSYGQALRRALGKHCRVRVLSRVGRVYVIAAPYKQTVMHNRKGIAV